MGAARPPLGRGTFACSHFSLLQTLSVSVVGISHLYLDISFSLLIVSVYKFKICVSEELTVGAFPLQRPKLGLLHWGTSLPSGENSIWERFSEVQKRI